MRILKHGGWAVLQVLLREVATRSADRPNQKGRKSRMCSVKKPA